MKWVCVRDFKVALGEIQDEADFLTEEDIVNLAHYANATLGRRNGMIEMS